MRRKRDVEGSAAAILVGVAGFLVAAAWAGTPSAWYDEADVLLSGSPADSATLLGSNLPPRAVRREDVAGRRILQFQRALAPRDAYARRLDRLGCRVVAETGRGRYRATLLQC